MLRARRRARRSTRRRRLRRRRAARRCATSASTSAPGEVVSLIGESGSGKIDDRPDDPAPARRRPRARSRFDGDDVAALTAAAAQGVLPRRPGRLPGPVQLVQPDLQGRPHLHDDPLGVLPARSRDRSGRAKLRGSLEAVGLDPARRARQVPAPAERRPAPAAARRAGAAARHRAPRRRRDHQHARRLDAHRRAQPARRPEGARARDPLHHARPVARQLHQRQDGHPAPRRRRRDGRDARRCSATRSTRTRRRCSRRVPQLHRKWSDAAGGAVGGARTAARSVDDGRDGGLVAVDDDHFVAPEEDEA